MTRRVNLVALLCATFLPLSASAVIVPVDCSVPDSINAAIASIAPPTLVEVEITNGPCAEDVIIRRNNVVVRPDPAGTGPFSITGSVTPDPDAEDATVLIRGSRRVTLDGITITGGRYGVRVVASQEEILFNDVSIDSNTVWGIQTLQASNIILEGTSSLDDNGRGGISVADTGAVTCRPCSTSGSSSFGIRAVQGAQVNVLDTSSIASAGRGIFLEDSRLKVDPRGVNPPQVIGATSGITAVHSEVELFDGTFVQATDNSGVAIDASNSSSVRVTGPALTEGLDNPTLEASGAAAFAVLLDGNSAANLTAAIVTGPISVRGKSHALVSGSMQQPSPGPANSANESSYLGIEDTTLVGDTLLTTYARGRFSASSLENLDCRQKARAICQGGTSISGTSGCSGCP